MRVVGPVERRRLRTHRDRNVPDREHVGHDRAAFLPARAHPGEGQQVRGSALGGEQTRWRRHAGVAPFELRRVPRHERGAGDVVEELEDRAPDHALLVGEALQLAAETARRAAAHEPLEAVDRG